MDLLDQIRTSQGQLPTRGVSLVNETRAGSADGPLLAFELANPQDIAHNPSRFRVNATLEDIAFLGRDTLLSVAQATGPLFGASAHESVFDWQSAANVARAAVMMQEVANGVKSHLVLNAGIPGDDSHAGLIGKTIVQSQKTGEQFCMYAVSFAIDVQQQDGYAASLPKFPWFKKFSDPDCFDYLFANIDIEDDGQAFLSIVLLSFAREIAPEDFAAMLLCYCEDEAAARDILMSLRDEGALFEAAFDRGDMFGLLTDEYGLAAREDDIDEGDRQKIARFVQGIVSLHVQGATVDLFRSDEMSGFLAFGSVLAFLWYGFARKLGQVRVGYCQQCGRPFSLAGHRGIPKRFCSDACKTKSKNERQRRINENVRERFLAGDSVEAVAHACYPKDARGVARAKVVRSLRQWVKLRHVVKEGLESGDESLVQRCIDEGIYTAEEVELRRPIARRAKR